MGELTAVGKHHEPTTVYAWINLTWVTLNNETTIAVADNVIAKAADYRESDKNVEGKGTLHILHHLRIESPQCRHPSNEEVRRSIDDQVVLYGLMTAGKI